MLKPASGHTIGSEQRSRHIQRGLEAFAEQKVFLISFRQNAQWNSCKSTYAFAKSVTSRAKGIRGITLPTSGSHRHFCASADASDIIKRRVKKSKNTLFHFPTGFMPTLPFSKNSQIQRGEHPVRVAQHRHSFPTGADRG